MQLTQFTDYSLRALIYIALKKGSCTIKDITDAYSISNNHLIKIIHNLSKMGLIKAIRGKNGGILMAASPETINLGQLIMELEPNFDLVPCFNKEKANCCIAPACKLKSVLYEAQRAFLQILEQYTLADVLHNPSELSVLLRIS
ncbi:Rrf2 family transcriptional regulator [Legionella pneumophila]|uniref:Rrf2 family transcriptional regulator n=1 Tax=Legionella pneumophila subsp. pneumophila TaxID=91891 RepID=A0A3A6W3P9_LEGPN|nr:Rrf2 family transcriptional regulator [Legionella pneumophila]QOD87791.1 Rrf2 family transcriptional regulator [Legionella pneumophila subsp. pneumophila]RJY27859.1 Rrf2 family transcriptional regulator [Legionella pneumophila subsp. pneumophila]RJY30502.1 Rrf2 family transcriptional regulator [Legionella pneumophila subsp. pneumophila]RJY34524.1 Rrf2 family transcriptional regulator [Legionella pneumophila subsp. pneumophila]RJY37432.1 Rrf2 family transcriptional regulator [Legionella pneu